MIWNNDDLLANYDFTSVNSSVPDTYANGTAVNASNIPDITDFQDSSKAMVGTIQTVLDAILFTFILWAGLYFLEKVIMLYITIHYNARSNFGKLERSKDIIGALAELYKASIYLYPMHQGEFSRDDAIIHNSPHSHHGDLKPVGALSRFVGTTTKGLTSALGG